MPTFALTFTRPDGSKRYDFCQSVLSLDEVRLHYRVMIRAGGEFVSVVVETLTSNQTKAIQCKRPRP